MRMTYSGFFIVFYLAFIFGLGRLPTGGDSRKGRAED